MYLSQYLNQYNIMQTRFFKLENNFEVERTIRYVNFIHLKQIRLLKMFV